MDNKLIPFPAPAPTAGPAGIQSFDRIIMQIGQQRIAFDISCQVTELGPPPETVVMPPSNRRGHKKRKGRTP
jgi:hypothetical protein